MFQLKKGDVLTEAQLDDAVHAVQVRALSLGMIPIAGIMSRRVGGDRHEVLGFGWNHLREGIPGVHGETGAIVDMGRVAGGYRDVVATSSLNPCPFCQRTLACHLGCGEVRILDVKNYSPDLESYKAIGLTPFQSHHEATAETFRRWVTDPANALIWERDIGIWDHSYSLPLDVNANAARVRDVMAMAHQKARDGLAAGEGPIGAVVVDAQGEVIGAGHAKVMAKNDPSCVAAMAAWRACGARAHWKDKTLFLTAGPDHIAYSMFHIFNFGQLVVGSDAVFKGQIDGVRKLGRVPVTVLGDGESDRALREWMATEKIERVREYLGADFQAGVAS